MTENQANHFPYLPHTEGDRAEMLAEIGVKSFEELISHVPAEIRVKDLNLPSGLSELEVQEKVGALAAKNVPASQQAFFLGGGSYRRFVPAAVGSIISRSEFATAYTPYQPEVSQGSLQAIYEFQSAVCLLTGMEVANASMYDGPTACAEAALMASRVTGRQKIYLSPSVNPEYAAVTETYAHACDLNIDTLSLNGGLTDVLTIKEAKDAAAIIVQYPNYFGLIEDIGQAQKVAHENGALLIVVTEPISLALLKSPGEFLADIVVGDAQACGNFLSFGGPSAGYMACRKEFIRQLPGRLAGKTLDVSGQTAYTLTLQTREQHIRRAKATSNICTNQALNALAMLVYLACLGPKGLAEVAKLSLERAHYLAEELRKIPGVELAFDAPFFNEFAITTPYSSALVLKSLAENGVLGGINLSNASVPIENGILIAVTETNKKAELDLYATTLRKLLTEELPATQSDSEARSISVVNFDKASSSVK